MKDNKKTEVITFRTDEDTKSMLEKIAEQNKWSVSQVVEQLIKNFIVDPEPGKIHIKTEELGRIYKELVEDDYPITEISIEYITEMEGEPEERTFRGILVAGIGHMGVGWCGDYDPIEELDENKFFDQ